MRRSSEVQQDDEREDPGWDPERLAYAIETSNGLLDELHALKYGELPHGLGWAWDRHQDVRKSVVIINGEVCLFDPITRKVTKQ